MTTLTPSDYAALGAMQRAARDLRLKASIAAYEHLRTRGVDHEEGPSGRRTSSRRPTAIRYSIKNTCLLQQPRRGGVDHNGRPTKQIQVRQLVELARTCMFQAKITMAKDVAAELRRMARECQRRAADLDGGGLPDIGEGD